MTEQQIRSLTMEALSETPGKAAQVTLLLKREDRWVILVKDGDEELAFGVEEGPETTPEKVKQAIVSEVRKLF